ncbi:MAG TPA: HlyD family type I secretion periplasmic adaptor subunit [Acetobacteraceae bacterium]|nr:HlyD family type I secretion periplasmic adaptor subunit [Acetobacteraceae bacterium]
MSGAVTIYQAPPDWRRPAMLGFTVIILAFGVFGGWAATTQITGAIVAQGVVAIESHSKPVQHLEEGIVSEVLVKEGDHVEKNQILVRLDSVVARATLDTYRDQLLAAQVYEARLIAERDDKPVITLPPKLLALSSDPVVRQAINDQQAQFENRQRSLQSQIGILDARIKGLHTQIEGLKIEQDSTARQVAYVDEELVGLRQLLAQQLVPLERVLSMEREKTRLEGEIGQAIADQARAGNAIGETQIQIQELRHKFQGDTAAAITDVQQKIIDLVQKQQIAQDALNRIDIRSPVTGTVQNLVVSGAGQVIRPGEALMEVVPDTETLIVRAEFRPTDISHVYAGQNAEVRFPSFHSRAVPVILGKLSSLSRDRITDDATHQSYYLGLIAVNKLDIPEELRLRLRAGMPAEVIVSSGKRTVLSYLTSPLMEAWLKSFREP